VNPTKPEDPSFLTSVDVMRRKKLAVFRCFWHLAERRLTKSLAAEGRMSSRTLVALVLATVGAAGGLAACRESKSEPVPSHPQATPAPKAAARADGDGGAGTGAVTADGTSDPPPYDGPLIGALYGQTPIMSDMDWPKKDDDRDQERSRKDRDKDKDKGAVRIGYIRQGSKVPVLPEPHPKHNCKEGWYELVQGGFVCGRYATLDLNHPKIKLAPHPPDMTAMLPYQYGVNLTNGTPLYKTVPSREERLKFEPWLAPKPKKVKPKEPPKDDDDTTASYGDESLDAGVPLTLAKATTLTASTTDPFGLSSEDALDAGTPWYLRQYDGGKPQVTLDELKGEGSLARRMVKGFFVGLDREYTASNGSKWWKTTATMLAPFERLMVHTSASKFHGIWLDEARDEARASAAVIAATIDAGAPPPASSAAPVAKKPTPDLCKPGSKAQVGVITFYRSKKYIVSVSRKAVTTGDPVPRHSVVKLTGDSVTINGAEYDETDEGWWMRTADGVKTNPGPAPRDLAPNEKWIDVNLKAQTLVAFEGDKPVFATAVSTGKEDKENEEKDHHTPPGSFRIREKHIAATMDGDVASDGPYSIEDVPWIMYFNGSYALHGAFWHNNWGHQQSHGCVNLAPLDGKALFGWTEPRLPDNWHGVMATPEKPGTRVIVHEQ
jgi:lipoprotein-anchoring transpeptidase ErfK/SrfK